MIYKMSISIKIIDISSFKTMLIIYKCYKITPNYIKIIEAKLH